MDVESVYRKIDEIKMEVDLAKTVADKLEPLLPLGWKCYYVLNWRGLCVMGDKYYTDKNGDLKENVACNPRNDFKYVCGIVSQATGKPVNREPWLSGDVLICLLGEVSYEKDNVRLTIQIRQFDKRDCQLEYEERTVKVAKLSEECLGVMGEKPDA